MYRQKEGFDEKKVFIYGSGVTGEQIRKRAFNSDAEILGFIDSDDKKIGIEKSGLYIFGPDILKKEQFDEIIVAVLSGFDSVVSQLVGYGVPRQKINTDFLAVSVRARENFVHEYAALVRNQGVTGALAEGGVYEGDFARVIKRAFPEKKMYLFDTFIGFPEQSIHPQDSLDVRRYSGHLSVSSIDKVLDKIGDPGMCCIRKGIFPDTTCGLEEEEFAFVSLDFDLFQPTLEGLRFFYPRMAENGVILIHDFFNKGYPGVRQAVEEFVAGQSSVKCLPIGDLYSVAIIK